MVSLAAPHCAGEIGDGGDLRPGIADDLADGIYDTDFAQATCGAIRLKLLKIGALVRISVRRIKIAMASACPAAQDWGRAAIRLAIAAIARMTRPAAARTSRHPPIGPRRAPKNTPQRALGRHGPAWLQHTSHQPRLIPCAIH